MVDDTTLVAVVGGDGRVPGRVIAEHPNFEVFQSPKDGGNGEARRLEGALRSGRFDRVVVLVRWNSHGLTRWLRRLCRQLRLPLEYVR